MEENLDMEHSGAADAQSRFPDAPVDPSNVRLELPRKARKEDYTDPMKNWLDHNNPWNQFDSRLRHQPFLGLDSRLRYQRYIELDSGNYSAVVQPEPDPTFNPPNHPLLITREDSRNGNPRSSSPVQSEPLTYYTVSSGARTFHSAVSRTFGNENAANVEGKTDFAKLTAYTKALKEQNLWPVDPLLEQNWSGRGQNAEFLKNERRLVDDILQVQDHLGKTTSAIVESVRCKRILLARKTIYCSRRMTIQQAIQEVAHLDKLRHAHVVRVIGTYIIESQLSILIYPVAEWNLEVFLKEEAPEVMSSGLLLDCPVTLLNFRICLSNALAFIHRHNTKHMDIKPQNILVRKRPLHYWGESAYKVYIADFGIARSYHTLEATETDGPTMYTPKYAAPEVANQETRGLAADIFSLGCVFFELVFIEVDLNHKELGIVPKTFRALENDFGVPAMDVDVSAIDTRPWSDILQERLQKNPNGDRSYQANIDVIQTVLSRLSDPLTPVFCPPLDVNRIKEMLNTDPTKRPTASRLVELWGSNACCIEQWEPLAAAL
ncbi:kinase-like protein [Byssothecium circinans]|uniref:Kinase-like protein n=1 Tax=Byssothecium circinans TaxID=147558 RepID=A0A6A5UA87_9PLEO|nr:kinase-like protein [Byssothecium circinans]